MHYIIAGLFVGKKLYNVALSLSLSFSLLFLSCRALLYRYTLCLTTYVSCWNCIKLCMSELILRNKLFLNCCYVHSGRGNNNGQLLSLLVRFSIVQVSGEWAESERERKRERKRGRYRERHRERGRKRRGLRRWTRCHQNNKVYARSLVAHIVVSYKQYHIQ